MLLRFMGDVISCGMALLHPPDAALTHAVIGSAIEVHRHLGPGLLESAYRECLLYELRTRSIPAESEIPVPSIYKGHALDVGYRLDLRVGAELVVELKAVEALAPIHHAQLITYMRLTGCRTGLLINFNVPLLRDGIRRVLL